MNNNPTNPADQSWAKIGRNRVTSCAKSLYPVVEAVKKVDLHKKQLANARKLDDFELLKVTKEELIGSEE